jgi:hypothetical protein
MKVTLIGVSHEVQWRDQTGYFRDVISKLIGAVDLIAEESVGLPTTVAQRLAFKFDKPWIEIDMTIVERKLAGIYDALIARATPPIDAFHNIGMQCLYLPHEDGEREKEWLRRILRHRVDTVLCICGFMHIGPFAKKLEEKGCIIEHIWLTEEEWFQQLYGKYKMVEQNGQLWCEMRHD